MKSNLILATTWLSSNQNRARKVAVGVVLAVAIVGSLVPGFAALAGPAVGGSH